MSELSDVNAIGSDRIAGAAAATTGVAVGVTPIAQAPMSAIVGEANQRDVSSILRPPLAGVVDLSASLCALYVNWAPKSRGSYALFSRIFHRTSDRYPMH